jgi:hypothetical protein
MTFRQISAPALVRIVAVVMCAAAATVLQARQAPPGQAQGPQGSQQAQQGTANPFGQGAIEEEHTPDRAAQFDQLGHALARLPLAAGLAVILAMRPRRKGTPHRRAPVIQTQIILAIVGAVVMLVVGASLARAFGIVGAAGLVRYRAKIDDPKDAGVMLSTLAVGLAAGVGLWMLAIFATGFILVVLGIIESFEPQAARPFTLEIKAKDPAAFKPKVEYLLRRAKLDYVLRTSAADELVYDVQVPLDRRTDRLPDHILKLDSENATAVEWKEKNDKKK